MDHTPVRIEVKVAKVFGSILSYRVTENESSGEHTPEDCVAVHCIDH